MWFSSHIPTFLALSTWKPRKLTMWRWAVWSRTALPAWTHWLLCRSYQNLPVVICFIVFWAAKYCMCLDLELHNCYRYRKGKKCGWMIHNVQLKIRFQGQSDECKQADAVKFWLCNQDTGCTLGSNGLEVLDDMWKVCLSWHNDVRDFLISKIVSNSPDTAGYLQFWYATRGQPTDQWAPSAKTCIRYEDNMMTEYCLRCPSRCLLDYTLYMM